MLHVCMCLCQNIANPQSRERWNPEQARRSVNPLSPAERGGGEEGQQHAEALTQLITHTTTEKSQKSDFCKPVLMTLSVWQH